MMDKVPTPTPLSHKGTWRTYTTADGLASFRIEHIVEDLKGDLWFATWESGVSRFDGDEFRTFTKQDGLCGNQVTAIHLDRQGRLWFGTRDGGACWYDGQVFHGFDEGNGVANGAVFYIFEDRDGLIWFGGIGLLGCYDGTNFRNLIPEYHRTFEQMGSSQSPYECWGIAQDKKGDLWFGLDYLVRYDGTHLHRHGEEDGLPIRGNGYAVAQDTEGGLWVGGLDTIGRYDGQTFTSVLVEPGRVIRKIQHDREGRTWFCTHGGVLCYDGTEFHQFTAQDGLAYDLVNGICQDREGQIWFATWGGGASCYDPHSMRVFVGGKEGLPRDILSTVIEDRRGHIWVGFWPFGPLQEGAACYDGKRFTVLGKEQGLDVGKCSAIYEDRNGHLWFGGFKGLAWYDGQTFQKIGPEEGFDGIEVSEIAEDCQGNLYFGHSDPASKEVQITCHDGQSFQTVFKEKKKDPFTRINAIIAMCNHELWFALGTLATLGQGKGIGRLRGTGDVAFYAVEDGLVDNRVEDLLEDRQDNLWIATLGGISRFDGTSFQNFTTKDGLPSDHVQSIYEDQVGNLWFGTDGGVVRYNGRTFQHIRSPYIGPTIRIIEDRTGKFWFATSNGLVRYVPSYTPPRIRLHQVIADKIYTVYQELEEIAISIASRQVTFEYKGLSFRTHPKDMLYTCKLEGYEEDWQPPTRQMRTFYQDLLPGEYTFQVRAIDRDLNYSAPAAIKITVLPDPHLQALTEALSGVAGQFVGQSRALGQVQADLAQVALTDLTVLILGETGTGKGLAARAIHHQSPRQGRPFIQVNCGAIPKELVESELFGHERGAFTGAISRKLGKFELAEGGTLFLDEIGDLPLGSQMALLQLLQEKTFQRVGGKEVLRSDVRIIAATNRDLEAAVQQGVFRKDLFYRLNGFVVELPPLRQRREDIPLLVEYFAREFARHLNRPAPAIDPEVGEYLLSYDWPGNVRELEHLVQRAVLLCKEGIIRREDLAVPSPPDRGGGTAGPVDGMLEAMLQDGSTNPDGDLLERAEEVVLRLALSKAQGNKSKAAALLHTDRKKVERRARKYRLGE